MFFEYVMYTFHRIGEQTGLKMWLKSLKFYKVSYQPQGIGRELSAKVISTTGLKAINCIRIALRGFIITDNSISKFALIQLQWGSRKWGNESIIVCNVCRMTYHVIGKVSACETEVRFVGNDQGTINFTLGHINFLCN